MFFLQTGGTRVSSHYLHGNRALSASVSVRVTSSPLSHTICLTILSPTDHPTVSSRGFDRQPIIVQSITALQVSVEW